MHGVVVVLPIHIPMIRGFPWYIALHLPGSCSVVTIEAYRLKIIQMSETGYMLSLFNTFYCEHEYLQSIFYSPCMFFFYYCLDQLWGTFGRPSAQTTTQNPLIYPKVSTLQFNLNTTVQYIFRVHCSS